MLHLIVHRLQGVNPMDGEATALHATEPGHLALGKLVDGYLQALEHLVVGKPAHQILRDKLILQSVVDEVVSRDALMKQPLNLVNHALFQAGLQSAGNLLATSLAVDAHTNTRGRCSHQ